MTIAFSSALSIRMQSCLVPVTLKSSKIIFPNHCIRPFISQIGNYRSSNMIHNIHNTNSLVPHLLPNLKPSYVSFLSKKTVVIPLHKISQEVQDSSTNLYRSDLTVFFLALLCIWGIAKLMGGNDTEPAKTKDLEHPLSEDELLILARKFNLDPRKVDLDTVSTKSYRDALEMACCKKVLNDCRNGKWEEILSVKSLVERLRYTCERPLFHTILLEGNQACILQFIKNKVCLLERDGEGNLPLHIAAKMGHTFLIPDLLQENDIFSQNYKNIGALGLSVCNGHIATFDKLLNYIPKTERKNALDKAKVLHLCVEYKQLGMLNHLLTAYPETKELILQRRDGISPYSLAQQAGYSKIISLLDKNKPLPPITPIIRKDSPKT